MNAAQPISIALSVLVCIGCGCASRGGAQDPRLATIVTFGDSTTAPRKIGASEMLEVYARVLERELPSHGIYARVINAGIGGNNTEQARARLQRDVLSLRPDVVIVQFGINDCAIDVHKGKTEPRVSQQRFAENLRTIVASLKSRDAQVILLTPNPLRWTAGVKSIFGKPPYDVNDPRGMNLLLDEYAESVREVAETENVPLIDILEHYEAWGREAGRGVDDLLLDGIHPNAQGQRMNAELIMELLDDVL